MSWSLLSGSPRLGEPVGAPRGLSHDGLVRRARVAAIVASLALTWAGAGLVAWLLSGAVALFGILPAFAVAGLLFLASRRQRPTLLRASAGFATLGVVLAVAGHLLHPRGEAFRPFVPPAFGADASALGLVALFVGLFVAPLVAAAWLRARTLSFDASGAAPDAAFAWARAFAQGDLDAAPRAASVILGALSLAAQAWQMPGFLLLDLVGTVSIRARDALQKRGRDRHHAQASPEELATALEGAGCQVEPQGAGLRVRVPEGGAVLLSPVHLPFPRVEASEAWDAIGRADDLRRLRRLLEGPLSARAVFSWSRVGRRVEARLNALLSEAERAATTEERGLLLEESERMERALAHRHLSAEERTLLVTWKLQRLRGLLAMRMLTEPPGARDEARVLAPAPALSPPLARVMDAGGLASMRRAVYVPHWIVPVRTAWGEREVVVNALTGRAEPADAPRLLEAMTRRGPTLGLEMGRPSAFLPAPVPTAALLREVRGLGEAKAEVLASVETVYVPFAPGPDGYVNVVTGTAAPDLGAVVHVAA